MPVVKRNNTRRPLWPVAAVCCLVAACDRGDAPELRVEAAPLEQPELPAPAALAPGVASTPERGDHAARQEAPALPAVVIRLRASSAAQHAWLDEAAPDLQRLTGARLEVERDTDLGAAAAVAAGLVPAAVVAGPALPRGARDLALGRMPVAVAVHPDNPLRAVSREDLVLLLAGPLEGWRSLGIPLGAVQHVALQSGHPLQEACERAVSPTCRLPRTTRRVADLDAVGRLLDDERAALALLPLAAARRLGLRVVSVDGVAPGASAAYPLGVDLALRVQDPPAPVIQGLLDQLCSPAGHELRARGLLP